MQEIVIFVEKESEKGLLKVKIIKKWLLPLYR